MYLLGIETSGAEVSFAVIDDERTLVESTHPTATDLSRHIINWIDEVLGAGTCSLRELGGLGVSVGPGSWTGLRIGVSTAKALGQALQIPVVGVATFDCLARFAALRWTTGALFTLAPSRRGEVFVGRYHILDGAAHVSEEPSVLPVEELREELAKTPEKVYVCGEGARVYQDRVAPVAVESFEHGPFLSRARMIARVALERQRKGDLQPLHSIKPCYLLPSQAERNAGLVVTG